MKRYSICLFFAVIELCSSSLLHAQVWQIITANNFSTVEEYGKESFTAVVSRDTVFTTTHRTTDGGATWKKIGDSMRVVGLTPQGNLLLAKDYQIRRLLQELHPTSELFRSTDFGTSWESIIRDAFAIDGIAVNKSIGEMMLTSWKVENGSNLYSHVRKSFDDGKTWEEFWYLPEDSPFHLPRQPYVQDISIADDGTSYFASHIKSDATYPGSALCRYLSTDKQPQRVIPYSIVYCLCTTPNGAVVALISREQYDTNHRYQILKPMVHRSTDQGITWDSNSAPPFDLSKLQGKQPCMIEHDGYIYCSANGNGIYRSSDLGKTWEILNTGLPHSGIYQLHKGFDGGLYAFLKDWETLTISLYRLNNVPSAIPDALNSETKNPLSISSNILGYELYGLTEEEIAIVEGK